MGEGSTVHELSRPVANRDCSELEMLDGPAGSHHQQGSWMIYGVFLPKDVLEKLDDKNAVRLLSGLKSPG